MIRLFEEIKTKFVCHSLIRRYSQISVPNAPIQKCINLGTHLDLMAGAQVVETTPKYIWEPYYPVKYLGFSYTRNYFHSYRRFTKHTIIPISYLHTLHCPLAGTLLHSHIDFDSLPYTLPIDPCQLLL